MLLFMIMNTKLYVTYIYNHTFQLLKSFSFYFSKMWNLVAFKSSEGKRAKIWVFINLPKCIKDCFCDYFVDYTLIQQVVSSFLLLVTGETAEASFNLEKTSSKSSASLLPKFIQFFDDVFWLKVAFLFILGKMLKAKFCLAIKRLETKDLAVYHIFWLIFSFILCTDSMLIFSEWQ